MNRDTPLPLAVAVCDGDIDRVEELLDSNEPINKRDYKGRTPLMLALLSVEMEIARLLVERGADTNLHDAKGRYPLHVSLLRPDVGVSELMLDKGARPDLPDRDNVTPLHLAAARGSAPLVARLMKQLAPLNARDKSGATPLHLAAVNNRPDATRALLYGEPDLEHRACDGKTAMFVAVAEGAYKVIKLLMAAGADPRAHARFGQTPLALAYSKKDYEAVELMEDIGIRDSIEAGYDAATEHLIPEAYCKDLESRLETLRRSIGPITNNPRFDANCFLEVFDRVRIKEGYVLDYYHTHLDREPHPKWGHGLDFEAEPYVFTRPGDQSHQEAAEIARDLFWRRPHLLKHLEYEQAPEGLLQWVIFRTAVRQFHLHWHANYNDLKYILSRTGLERIMESLPLTRTKIRPFHRYSLEQLSRGAPLTEPDRDKLRALDLTPWVRLVGDLGEVRVFTFTKWGGFSWHHYHLRCPHHVDRSDTEAVVHYNCGITF